MPRRKRTSQVLEDAQNRIAALRTIAPSLDLGNGISVSAFNGKIEETRIAIESYNHSLSHLDQSGSTIRDLEKSLNELSSRLLSGVITVYGRSSSQYKIVSGSRRRRRSTAAVTAPKQTPETP
jgi:chromosome condensin MukBEF ATPase and DNA-binding subunit MukB